MDITQWRAFFSNNLKRLIDEHPTLDKKTFAKIVAKKGVSSATLSNYLGAARLPQNPTVAEDLAETLGVSPASLYGWADTPSALPAKAQGSKHFTLGQAFNSYPAGSVIHYKDLDTEQPLTQGLYVIDTVLTPMLMTLTVKATSDIELSQPGRPAETYSPDQFKKIQLSGRVVAISSPI